MGPCQASRAVAGSSEARRSAILVSTESMDLLNKYLERKILGPKFQNDMLHIGQLELPPHRPAGQDSAV